MTPAAPLTPLSTLTHTVSHPREWLALGAIMLGVALGALDTAIANTALPAIATDLQAPAAHSIWIINAYQLAVVATMLPFAALGDWVGHGASLSAGWRALRWHRCCVLLRAACPSWRWPGRCRVLARGP